VPGVARQAVAGQAARPPRPGSRRAGQRPPLLSRQRRQGARDGWPGRGARPGTRGRAAAPRRG